MNIFKEKYSPKEIEKELKEKERGYRGDSEAVNSEYINLETREKRLNIADAFISTLLTVIFTFAYKFFGGGNDESLLLAVLVSFLFSFCLVKAIQEEEYVSLIKNKQILRAVMDKYEKNKKIEQDIKLKHADELIKAMSRLCALERNMVRKNEKNYTDDKLFDVEDCLSIMMIHIGDEYSIKFDAWLNLVDEVLLLDSSVNGEENRRVLLERIDIQQKEMKELYGEILDSIMGVSK